MTKLRIIHVLLAAAVLYVAVTLALIWVLIDTLIR